MRKPEEIKKGLVACSADECHGQHTDCPYHPDLMCIRNICADALALIKQLEEELQDTRKAVDSTNGLCDICKHQNAHEIECEASDFLCYNCTADCACKECYPKDSHYEWRGVKEDTHERNL